MKKKASKAQMAGVKAFQEQRSAENIAKANAAIDKLYRQGKEVRVWREPHWTLWKS